MTNNEAPKCYFCETATATHLKLDDTIDYVGEEDVLVLTELLICLPCEDENYDGTEARPGVTAL
jgi:hypothetical protein